MRREELRLGLVAYPGLGGSGTVAAELADRPEILESGYLGP